MSVSKAALVVALVGTLGLAGCAAEADYASPGYRPVTSGPVYVDGGWVYGPPRWRHPPPPPLPPPPRPPHRVRPSPEPPGAYYVRPPGRAHPYRPPAER